MRIQVAFTSIVYEIGHQPVFRRLSTDALQTLSNPTPSGNVKKRLKVRSQIPVEYTAFNVINPFVEVSGQ